MVLASVGAAAAAGKLMVSSKNCVIFFRCFFFLFQNILAPEIALTTLTYPNTVEIPIGGNYSELWDEWNGMNGFPSPGHDPPVQLSPDDSGQEPPPSYDEAVNGYWTRISSMIHA